METTPRFVYFGGEPLGVPVLEELEHAGLRPGLIVCNPDRPVGRKQVLTPPPVKTWAEQRSIEVYQPDSYKGEGPRAKLAAQAWDLFVVVAYNSILPQWVLDIPTHGVLNVHPSLLPKLRGASPIRSAILRDERESIGVTVMLMDAQMDHGPILAQQPLPISDGNWPVPGPELDEALARSGGALLASTVAQWLSGSIEPQPQDHNAASYCGKLTKADSELTIDPHHLPQGAAAWDAWLKINAFAGIGDTFFIHEGQRVKVKTAEYVDSRLELVTVTPEGRGPTDFAQYVRSLG
jgi:methionyl-tRNA formyltransferase